MRASQRKSTGLIARVIGVLLLQLITMAIPSAIEKMLKLVCSEEGELSCSNWLLQKPKTEKKAVSNDAFTKPDHASSSRCVVVN